MKPRVYFDMDGTIADLYGVKSWLELIRAEKTAPYREAQPMIDYHRATNIMRSMREHGFIFQIISWGSKTGSQEFLRKTARVKRDWARQYFPHVFTRYHITDYGIPKHKIVNPSGNYLFDDNENVGHDWESAGGIWIDVKHKDILNELNKLATL